MTSEQYQAYIDTYMRNINSTDLGNLANVGNRVIHVSNQKKDFILPKLGKYYKKTWQIEDEKFIKKYGLAALTGTTTSSTTSPSGTSTSGSSNRLNLGYANNNDNIASLSPSSSSSSSIDTSDSTVTADMNDDGDDEDTDDDNDDDADSISIEESFYKTCNEIKQLEMDNKRIIDDVIDISVVHQLSNKIRQSAENILIKLADAIFEQRKTKTTRTDLDNEENMLAHSGKTLSTIKKKIIVKNDKTTTNTNKKKNKNKNKNAVLVKKKKRKNNNNNNKRKKSNNNENRKRSS